MSNLTGSNSIATELGLTIFNTIWAILDDSRALSKISEESLIKNLIYSNFDLLQPRLNFNSYRPSILHKVFRNSEDIHSLEGMRFMKNLLSHSDLNHIDINSKKAEMNQAAEGGLCESYAINIQRMRDIEKIVGKEDIKWFAFV